MEFPIIPVQRLAHSLLILFRRHLLVVMAIDQ